ncbi:MAG TPA: class I SAM-dependent methyltransferase [Methylomirabilota bacterium]
MSIERFYDDHPISETHVLDAVRRGRGGLDTPVTADDLSAFDQDHYGGLAAVETLAHRARIRRGARVLDVGAGLGGPARFLAGGRGCHVVALELHAGRAGAARRLSRLCRLDRLVHVVRGDATRLPFADGGFDACVSQEAFMHIADKAAVLAGCRRVLVTGGRLAFTDWIAHARLADGERRRLREWMAGTAVETLDGYRTLLGRAGFTALDVEDITDEWRPVLRTRHGMYRRLRAATIAKVGAARFHAYDALYTFLIDLVEDGKLGGGRFSGSR